jgi:hypothetical protein
MNSKVDTDKTGAKNWTSNVLSVAFHLETISQDRTKFRLGRLEHRPSIVDKHYRLSMH